MASVLIFGLLQGHSLRYGRFSVNNSKCTAQSSWVIVNEIGKNDNDPTKDVPQLYNNRNIRRAPHKLLMCSKYIYDTI